MTSLREQLAAKQRRRLSVPIQVSDPGPDQQDWNGIAVALAAARQRDDQDVVRRLEEQLAEQTGKVQAHYAQVELQALPRDVWNEVTTAWQTVEVTEDGPEAVTDWAQALAPLLADSCVDPELRDADWWREQLSKPEWSEGDTNALKLALLRLNVDAVDPQIPKG